jgi:hypothetical protein
MTAPSPESGDLVAEGPHYGDQAVFACVLVVDLHLPLDAEEIR